MLNLYLVRHGQTAWNLQGRLQGAKDIPLDETGLTQADRLGGHLRDISFESIYVSPLVRTRQTLEGILAHQNGSAPEPQVAEDLHEIRCGAWEGEVMISLAEHQQDLWRAWLADPHMPCPEGESFADVRDRVAPFLDQVLESHDNGNVLLVSHGGVNRMVLAHLMKLDLQAARYFSQENCCINTFHRRPGWKLRVKTWNQTTHL